MGNMDYFTILNCRGKSYFGLKTTWGATTRASQHSRLGSDCPPLEAAS